MKRESMYTVRVGKDEKLKLKKLALDIKKKTGESYPEIIHKALKTRWCAL